jgi:hypothetical protein
MRGTSTNQEPSNACFKLPPSRQLAPKTLLSKRLGRGCKAIRREGSGGEARREAMCASVGRSLRASEPRELGSVAQPHPQASYGGGGSPLETSALTSEPRRRQKKGARGMGDGREQSIIRQESHSIIQCVSANIKQIYSFQFLFFCHHLRGTFSMNVPFQGTPLIRVTLRGFVAR